MKHFLFFILSVSFALGTFAQELKIKSCTLASTDVTASSLENIRMDDVGNPCALVKILLLDGISKVQGNVIGDIKEYSSEKWVYLSKGTKEIRIIPMHYKPLRVYFPDFGIDGVESKRTYVLDLVKATGGAESIMQQNQSLIIKYSPSTATVLVDNKMVRGSNGVAKTTLPVGQHSFVVFCDGYESEEGTVKLKASAPSNLQITLTKETIEESSVNETSQRSQKRVNQQAEVNLSQPTITNQVTSSVASNSNTISISVKDGVSIDMVKVEAGTFMMGATSEMKNPDIDEKPVHQVTLTNDYYMGKYEVTQALWEAVMGSNPSKYKGDNLPVESVSWNDCQEFISRLNSLTGRKFRLPTEAEWEYAARGGKKSRSYQYSGSSNISDVAWYDENCGSTTRAVGTKRPNELGIYDMSGNVWEWCHDWYSSYSSLSQMNPIGAISGACRVRRGGSWDNSVWYSRSSSRSYDTSDYSRINLGLRLALTE